MRRLALSVVCAFGAIAMAACSASESVDGNKSTLEKDGYTVSVYNAEEYKKLSIASTFSGTEGLQNHMVAVKASAALTIVAWYFDSTDRADGWMNANMSILVNFYREEGKTSFGLRNNVVWAGSVATARLLTWTTL